MSKLQLGIELFVVACGVVMVGAAIVFILGTQFGLIHVLPH